MDCFTQKPPNSHITLQIGTELSTQVVFCAARSKHNRSPPRLFSVTPTIFLSPMGWLLFFLSLLACHHHSYRALLQKHVDKWSFVNFDISNIYSVTKQLLELALWAGFLFRLVISCLEANGPWAASPPMTGAPSRNLFIIATEKRFPKSIFRFNEVYWHR